MNQFIQLVTIVAIIWYTVAQRGEAKQGKGKDVLAGREKILIWVLSILNPILTGLVMYFGLRKLLPNKAKQINKITLIAFLIFIAVYVTMNVLNPGFFIAG